MKEFLVLADDNGIRPAGKPDECFYCHRQVGRHHHTSCATIVEDVTYEVRMNGKVVGTWTRPDPFYWGVAMCEYHKNESSWCADNALDGIVWSDLEAKKWCLQPAENDGCCRCCGTLRFKYLDSTGIPYRSKD